MPPRFELGQQRSPTNRLRVGIKDGYDQVEGTGGNVGHRVAGTPSQLMKGLSERGQTPKNEPEGPRTGGPAVRTEPVSSREFFGRTFVDHRRRERPKPSGIGGSFGLRDLQSGMGEEDAPVEFVRTGSDPAKSAS